MRKYVAIVATMFLLVNTAGCIDVHLMKEMIFGEEATEYIYGDVDGPSLVHQFHIAVATSILDDIVYDESQFIEIEEGSLKLSLNYNVTMENIPPEVMDTIVGILNGAGLGDYVQIIEEMNRHVTIEVYEPGNYNEPVWAETYTSTSAASIQKFFPEPKPGEWKVRVEARGIGYDDLGFQDSFAVFTSIRQPVGERTV